HRGLFSQGRERDSAENGQQRGRGGNHFSWSARNDNSLPDLMALRSIDAGRSGRTMDVRRRAIGRYEEPRSGDRRPERNLLDLQAPRWARGALDLRRKLAARSSHVRASRIAASGGDARARELVAESGFGWAVARCKRVTSSDGVVRN